MGAAASGALAIAGRVDDALWSMGSMVLFAAVFAFGGRSETIRGLRGDGRDERFMAMDMRASLMAGMAVIVAVIVASVVSAVNGHEGAPYNWLAALAGLTYLAGIVWQRIRG